eukprot:CAMPEP_0114168420 /NCGR_PEP_ID=MMETSP0043_2-20121206/32980_1 /TAXON_ID=464988 /ORGANISM="Hemiselmis andersenii, Strain CCMP644" /LENGTH=43 /DNA_ID= /DNA_START= /DNA_END= /DNA_ORIENTATION=
MGLCTLARKKSTPVTDGAGGELEAEELSRGVGPAGEGGGGGSE